MEKYTEAQEELYEYLYQTICGSDNPNLNATLFFEEYEKNPDDVINNLKNKLQIYCHPRDLKEVIEDFESEFIEE
jgi:transcriptional/translational regulatory protein YebC/TACO1